jgi:hypothetical protein
MRSTSFQTLDIDQLRARAPSIFTTEAAEHTSSKYKHISTLEVVNGLMREGFMPVKAMQSGSRLPDRKAFTKHMIRFRHVDTVPTVNGGLFPELVLINSHDGMSSYKLMAGLYRLVCSNGLVSGNTFKSVRVRHQGDIINNVIEGSYEVMSESRLLLDNAESMNSIILNGDEKRAFAQAVHELRFDGATVEESGIQPEQFLKPRRYDEQGKHDLFTTFNIAQENVIKGGLKGWAIDPEGKYTLRGTGDKVRKVSTSEIKSIDKNTSLNRALWTLAEKMRELKAA